MAPRPPRHPRSIVLATAVVFDPVFRRALLGRLPVPLKLRQALALECLASQPGIPVTREQLRTVVWEPDVPLYRAALDILIFRLRRRIEPNPQHPTLILTVRGVGYMLAAPAAKSGLLQPGSSGSNLSHPQDTCPTCERTASCFLVRCIPAVLDPRSRPAAHPGGR